MLESLAVTFVSGALMVLGIHKYAANPQPGLFESLAQIGAALLIGYAVEVGWLLKESHRRSASEENWVGIGTGFGTCGLLGIGISLGLSQHGERPLTLIEEIGFGWSMVSIGLLGLLVAVMPGALYEWVHSLRVEDPDE